MEDIDPNHFVKITYLNPFHNDLDEDDLATHVELFEQLLAAGNPYRFVEEAEDGYRIYESQNGDEIHRVALKQLDDGQILCRDIDLLETFVVLIEIVNQGGRKKRKKTRRRRRRLRSKKRRYNIFF
jgi:hypothetical protein